VDLKRGIVLDIGVLAVVVLLPLLTGRFLEVPESRSIAIRTIDWQAAPACRRQIAFNRSNQIDRSEQLKPAVLVELFTSEGCSSCPPADRLLTTLDETQPIKSAQIIVLSEHVDYWNRYGWKDPFSSSEFSRRQNEYARMMESDDVYTPQMIVDGKIAFVGSNADKATSAIAAAARSPKAKVSLEMSPNPPGSITFSVQVEDLPEARTEASDVLLAITENRLSSKVSRGENAGRRLQHSAVTRKLMRIGGVEGSQPFRGSKAIKFESTWNRSNLMAVAFVQQHKSLKVLGAASIPLSRATQGSASSELRRRQALSPKAHQSNSRRDECQ
jgi:hypothetical protein